MKTTIISGLAMMASGVAAQNSDQVVITQTISPDCLLGAGSAPTSCNLPIFEHLNQVCLPQTSNATKDSPQYDPQAPCVALVAIEFQCLYGVDAGRKLFPQILAGTTYGGDEGGMTPDNSTQRNCVCTSAFFDAIKGCSQCFAKHGVTSLLQQLSSGIRQSGPGPLNYDLPSLDNFSRSYCAASATPTINFGEALLYAAETIVGGATTAPVSIPTTSTYTLTDPLGNKTDIFLYYTTPGTSYWAITSATGSPSVRNGQIVATVSTGAAPAGTNSGSAAPSSTGGSGAGSLTSLGGGAIAVLAGVVAML